TDFSRMTDAQLLDFFREFNGAACGRFRKEQLERVIHAVEIPRSTWWARVAAGVLLALGLSKDADAQAERKAPVEQHSIEEKGTADSTTTAHSGKGFEIYGTLKDERGEPIVAAIVEISNQGTVTGRALTDFDGNYSATTLKGGNYDVKFSYLGKERIIKGVNTKKQKTK